MARGVKHVKEDHLKRDSITLKQAGFCHPRHHYRSLLLIPTTANSVISAAVPLDKSGFPELTENMPPVLFVTLKVAYTMKRLRRNSGRF